MRPRPFVLCSSRPTVTWRRSQGLLLDVQFSIHGPRRFGPDGATRMAPKTAAPWIQAHLRHGQAEVVLGLQPVTRN